MDNTIIGEGSLAAIFPTSQSFISITFFGGQQEGKTYISFFREDGTRIGIATLKNLICFQPYYFKLDTPIIKGFSVHGDNIGGLGIYEIGYSYSPGDFAVSGYVFADLDQDGLYNSSNDVLYEGVVVKLFNCYTGTSATNYFGSSVGDEVTDANGEYSFQTLLPGSYKVQFIAPDGTNFTTSSAFEPTELDYDSDADSNGYTTCFNVNSNVTGICAGLTLTEQTQVYDTVGEHTWNKPVGAVAIKVIIVGGGGSGASPPRWWNGPGNGAGGGGGGAYREVTLDAAVVDSSVVLGVGYGGTAVPPVNDFFGKSGFKGSCSYFGSYYAYGGGGGGAQNTPMSGGGGGGYIDSGYQAVNYYNASNYYNSWPLYPGGGPGGYTGSGSYGWYGGGGGGGSEHGFGYAASNGASGGGGGGPGGGGGGQQYHNGGDSIGYLGSIFAAGGTIYGGSGYTLDNGYLASSLRGCGGGGGATGKDGVTAPFYHGGWGGDGQKPGGGGGGGGAIGFDNLSIRQGYVVGGGGRGGDGAVIVITYFE